MWLALVTQKATQYVIGIIIAQDSRQIHCGTMGGNEGDLENELS